MPEYPKAAERVAYNVPIGGILEDSMIEEVAEPFRYASSLDTVHPLDTSEVDAVHRHIYRAIRRYIRSCRIPLLTDLRERTWSRDNIGDPLGDRTVPVVFISLGMVDEKFVDFAQSHVLRRYPEWRMLHCEDRARADLNLAIYPDAVSVGNSLARKDFSSLLRSWRQHVTQFQERHCGSLRRQLHVVQSMIIAQPPTVWRNWAPVVVAAFDNYQGEQDYQAIWTLVSGESPFDDEIDAEAMEEGQYYPVERSGRIGQVMGNDSPTRLWIRDIAVPRKYLQRLLLKDHRRHFGSELTVSQFRGDADLPGAESGAGSASIE